MRSMLFTFIFFLVTLMCHSTLHADSFDLKLKKIKITKKNSGIFPEVPLASRHSFKMKEPKYRSDDPQRFIAHVGAGSAYPVIFAVDEKKGAGKGFDLLYADVKATGELFKGRKISGKKSSEVDWYEALDFPTLEIQVPMGDGEKPFGLPMSLRFYKMKGSTVSWLYLTSLCLLEGEVQINGSKLKIYVFDADCNGIFGDKAQAKGTDIVGDWIWLGEGKPSPEMACAESVPLGKYVCFKDRYYDLAFSGNRCVEIAEAQVALGKIRVNQAGFLLELVQDGAVVYAENQSGNEITVPVGEYRVNSASFRHKYKGKLWSLEGASNPRSKAFEVKAEQVTAIDIGPPLKLVIRSELSNRGSSFIASMNFLIKGSQNEEYVGLRRDGKRVKLPSIEIKNSRNRVVEKGRFEYG